MLPQPPPKRKGKREKKKKWNEYFPPPVDRLQNISILVSMSLSPINLKCWILQNVMLYFVCEIMLKLCVLNVKTRLLYCKAKLMLVFPNVSEQGRMFLNLFYNII